MRAFLTGSHAYGTPTPASDVDLAVMMNPNDHSQLASLAERIGDSTSESLTFGKLNLLLFFNEATFSAWKTATEILTARKPVTREEAINVIDEEVAKIGVTP